MNPKALKLNSNAKIPTKNKEDGGFDLYAVFDKPVVVHKPHEIMMFNTGLKIAFDTDYVALFRERGSTGIKNMQVRAGVVEGNFRGEYKIMLSNGNEYLDIVYVKDNYDIQELLNEMHKIYPNYGWNTVKVEDTEIIKDELDREVFIDKTYLREFEEPNEILFSNSYEKMFYIHSQSKAIAQMIIVKKEDWTFDEVDEEHFDTLVTERGGGMLGSSGK